MPTPKFNYALNDLPEELRRVYINYALITDALFGDTQEELPPDWIDRDEWYLEENANP